MLGVLCPSLLSLSMLAAPGLHCHGDPSANEIARTAHLAAFPADARLRAARPGERAVRVQFHVVRNGSGTGGLAASELEDEFNRLNTLFAPADLRFCLAGPTRFIDSTLFFSQTNTFARINQLRRTNPEPDAINVYWVPFVGIEGIGEILGISSFTFETTQGIVMSNLAATSTTWRGVLAHEIGHYFDLYHTFETAFGAECPNGVNCGSAGDLICDTPADPGVFQYASCVWTGSAPPRCGSSAFTPPATNLMNYTGACMNDLTPQQIERMIETLELFRPELLAAGCPPLACSPADVTATGSSAGEPDGLIDVSDYSFYLTLWAAADPAADLTTTGSSNGMPDGIVDVSDFSTYLTLWAAGCP